TSVVMTSATLGIRSPERNEPSRPEKTTNKSAREPAMATSPLNYFSRRVGAESATLLQVGTPFDYERQMKLFAVKKMPDPRDAGYADSLEHWIRHFIKQTHGKAFVLFTN